MRASEEKSFDWGSTYRFGTYNSVMVNAYKALARLARGDREGARVEIEPDAGARQPHRGALPSARSRPTGSKPKESGRRIRRTAKPWRRPSKVRNTAS